MSRNTPPVRRLTILDGIVLVAGAAVASMIWRHFGEAIWREAWSARRSGSWPKVNVWVAAIVAATCPFVAVAAPTLLALRFRAPRPRRRILWSQPGASACLAVILVMLFQATWNIAFDLRMQSVRLRFPLISYSPRVLGWLVVVPTEEGLAVAATWLILAVGGRLRPERSWIDRAGRAVGFYFLASIPLAWLALW